MFIIQNKKDFNIKLIKKNKRPPTDGALEYGSTRFLTDHEIKKQFDKWTIGNDLSNGGIPVTTISKKIYYDKSFEHTLIIGSTGSGKTVNCIIPLIINLSYANESMIINDPKGELYQKTATHLKKIRGFDVKVINLRNATSSDCWNPLHLAYRYYKNNDIEQAVDIIENFSKGLCNNLASSDPYWELSTCSILSALCYAIIEDAPNENQVNLYSVYNLLVEHGNKYINRENSLDLYFQDKPTGSLSKMAYATGGFAEGETRATIFSLLATTLKLFSDVGIASLTSHSNFELEDIGKKKTAVFLIVPDEKESRHQLVSLFIDQCYQALINYAQSQDNGKLLIRTNFVLDEFSNMPTINGFSNKITVSRSRDIRFYLVVQDFNQLEEKYHKVSKTITSNCTNWIYLLTTDNNTASEISKRLGKYTIATSRYSTSAKVTDTTYNLSSDKSLLGRDLLSPDELMRLDFGTGLFLKSRSLPIMSIFTPYYKMPIKLETTDLPATNKYKKSECFNLDLYRKRQVSDKENDLYEIE